MFVDKRLRITDAGDGRPTIDGRCKSDRVLDVQHAGVVLDGLRVRGAADTTGFTGYSVNLIAIPTGAVRDMVLRETCGGAEAALYGVNVYQGGRLELRDIDAKGFTDAGIYVGSIEDTDSEPLRVKGNDTHGNNIGVLIEDAEDSADVDVRVRENRTNGNALAGESTPAGILLRRSDGVLVDGNITNDNGAYGIHIDDQSDGNIINNNASGDNLVDNFFDEGSGNCGSGNTGFTIDPCM